MSVIYTTTDVYLDMDRPNFTLKGNETLDFNSTVVKTSLNLYDVVIPSVGVIIILANLAVVVSSGLILKKGQEPRSTYLFLGNVALTDFFTGISVVFGQTFPKDYRDHYVCSFQIGLIVSSTLASVLSVGLIAIDRYLYILYGLKYTKWVYPARARLCIAFTWLIGCIFGFLPLMGWYGDTDNGRICWFILLAPKELVLLTVLIGVVPLLIVIFLYSVILFHALKKIFQLQNLNNSEMTQNDNPVKNLRMFRGKAETSDTADNQDETENKGLFKIFKKKPSRSVKAPSKWKAIKVVLFTTGSFVVTWSPYFVVSCIYVFNCNFSTESQHCKTMRLLIASPLAILGFMNSLFNPIIYAWWHKGFRNFVKKRVATMSLKGLDLHQSQASNQSKDTNSTNSSRKNSTSTSGKINEDPS